MAARVTMSLVFIYSINLQSACPEIELTLCLTISNRISIKSRIRIACRLLMMHFLPLLELIWGRC